MGANSFSQLEVGKYKTAGEAYRAAKQEAAWEDGHDPYNGTISTCTDLSSAPKMPRFGTKAFDKAEEKLTEDLGKRECLYIELTGAALKKAKGNRFAGARGIKAFYLFGVAAC